MPLNSQLGVVDESTYGTPVTVTRFYEFNSESIAADLRRITGSALRSTGRAERTDRNTPYIGGASGSVSMDVMTNGFGWWLKHMLGTTATATVGGDGEYAHTGTVGSLSGDFFSLQVNRPTTDQSDQAVSFEGGKVTGWSIACQAEGLLTANLECDFENELTATALATASYPTGQENFSFVGADITLGGTSVPVTSFEVSCENNLNTDRRKLRSAGAQKQEPTEQGNRAISYSLEADFESLTQYDRAKAIISATNYAQIVATFQGPTVIAGSTYPTLVVTLPGCRFDQPLPTVSGPEELTQSLSGPVHYDGTNELISVVYTSDDATA